MAATAMLRSPGVSSAGRYFEAEFDIVFSGTYVTGGDVVNFAVPGFSGFGTPSVALMPTAVAGFTVTPVVGTSPANHKLMIFDDALAQHAAAAVNAAVTAVTFRAIVRIPKYKR